MSPRGRPAMAFGVPPLTRGVKWLGGVTLAVSILVAVLRDQSGVALAQFVVFSPEALWHGAVWKIFTYTFLNPDPVGLLFALLGLWLLGASLEQTWGTRRFLTFYFATAAAAALAASVQPAACRPRQGRRSGTLQRRPRLGQVSSLEHISKPACECLRSRVAAIRPSAGAASGSRASKGIAATQLLVPRKTGFLPVL